MTDWHVLTALAEKGKSYGKWSNFSPADCYILEGILIPSMGGILWFLERREALNKNDALEDLGWKKMLSGSIYISSQAVSSFSQRFQTHFTQRFRKAFTGPAEGWM